MPFAYDPINQKFVFHSPVNESSPLAKCALAEHVDHAIIALDGRAPFAGDCALEQINPVSGPTTLRIDLWVADIGTFSCTYGFLISSEDGCDAYARGERTVLNLDPHSHAPQPWDEQFRASHRSLEKDLLAYA